MLTISIGATLTTMSNPRLTLASRMVSDDWRLGVALATGAALLIGFSLQQLVDDSWGQWAVGFHKAGGALVWISLALGAIHGVKAAVESLRDFKPDIDVLMVVGAGLAAHIGHPGEGALLLFMFTLAGALEYRALAKAKDAVSRLNKLMPNEALKQIKGAWIAVDPKTLEAGDLVLVRPGETIPVDGEVAVGAGAVNQSTLTGESLPRPVDVGDAVYAGTLNENSPLEIRVNRPVQESSLQRILDLVIEAQSQRQPMQRMIDSFSTPYTIGVFAFAIAVLLYFMFAPERFTGQAMTFDDAAYRAITLLIVMSPCALVIATPTATLCGLNRAAKGGLLVKGGDALERLSRVRQVVVDKTGTLTTGKIEVTSFELTDGADVEKLLPVALAMEERSTHPIAASITRFLREREVQPAVIENHELVAGKGLTASCEGQAARFGTVEFVAPYVDPALRERIEGEVLRVRKLGQLTAVFSMGGEAIVFALADTLRPGADRFVEELRAVGVDSVVMLTGDHQLVAEKVAAELGIEQFHAELMPEEKVAHIRRLRDEEGGARRLAVIGDGVNDAPALAIADIGLAMGGIGADAALEAADVVILHDDLRVAPWSIRLARRVRFVMAQNLLIAMGVIFVLAIFALFGWIPMGVGVIGHEGSTLIVVANSLQILGVADPNLDTPE